MAKRMLLNIQPDEERVAIVEDGVLDNLEIETCGSQTLKGNIYKAVIRKVEPSLQACFVEYGSAKNGFLPRSEVISSLYTGSGGPPPIQEIFKEGQEVMVQVVRDAIGNKGVTFSTFVTLAGRYLVLVPDSDRVAISRKLPSSERTRFKAISEGLVLRPDHPHGGGGPRPGRGPGGPRVPEGPHRGDPGALRPQARRRDHLPRG